MRYYHYIALAVAAVSAALGASLSQYRGSIVLYLVGIALAGWVGNVLRRARSQLRADAWREEQKPWWRQQSAGWQGSAVVLAIILVATVALLVVDLAGDFSTGSGPHTYEDKAYDFTFTYPASWGVGEYEGTADTFRVGVVDPKGAKLTTVGYIDAMSVSAGRRGPNVSYPPTNATVEEVMGALAARYSDAKLLQPLRQTPVGNKSGWTWSSTHSVEGVPVTLQTYWLLSGDILYEVVCQASQANWAADAPIFDSIIASFQAP